MWTWCKDYVPGENKFYDESKTISDSIAEIIRQHGPFDGVIGFSSGACVAALIASLLEKGREQAFEKRISKNGMPYPRSFIRDTKSVGKHEMLQLPLKFVVCYSGFSLDHAKYSAFYQPQIQTPTLHIIGKWDTVVEEQQSLSLTRKCGGKPTVFYHLGSHFVPQQSCYISMVTNFILDSVTVQKSAFALPLCTENTSEFA
jgi:dihydrofolate reductase